MTLAPLQINKIHKFFLHKFSKAFSVLNKTIVMLVCSYLRLWCIVIKRNVYRPQPCAHTITIVKHSFSKVPSEHEHTHKHTLTHLNYILIQVRLWISVFGSPWMGMYSWTFNTGNLDSFFNMFSKDVWKCFPRSDWTKISL